VAAVAVTKGKEVVMVVTAVAAEVAVEATKEKEAVTVVMAEVLVATLVAAQAVVLVIHLAVEDLAEAQILERKESQSLAENVEGKRSQPVAVLEGVEEEILKTFSVASI
jgi:hypothetical protein